MQGGPVCFPTSLCDFTGILAQALARVMGPDPLPRNSPQGPLFRDHQSPGGGRGGSTFSAPALSSCPRRRPPRPGARGQHRPLQAPPRAARAPPATRPPAAATHPGRPRRPEARQPRRGHRSCAHPGPWDPTDPGGAAFGWNLDPPRTRGFTNRTPVALRKLRSTQAEALSSTQPMPSPPLFPCWAVNRVALMAEDVCEPRFLHP